MNVRPISDAATVVVERDALATQFGDEIVILSLRDGVYYGLEGVGIRIWSLLQAPCTIASVCSALMAEFDVGLARCRRDVIRLLNDLHAKGLVEILNSR
jgi:hypothetical protein